MADLSTQLQNIKFQLKSADLSFDNMITLIQNNNLMNSSTQIKTIGIQMLNIGIQMFNIGLQIPNMNNDSNLFQQIQNISNQIKLIETQMNNNILMQMNNNMINNMEGMFGPNQFGNQMNNIMGMNINNNIINFSGNNLKKQVTFQKTSGECKIMVFDYGTTVNDILRKYLIEIGKPELLENEDKIGFFYNAQKLRFNDKTKIEDFFLANLNPKVIVMNLNT